MSSSFASQVVAPSAAPPDPHKHVNYTLGMVLGVDDFTQEFAYLSGRDQWLARDLIGYGTACGLQVTIDTDSNGNPRVSVSPGAAVSPRGQLIRITPTQCANLNDWLVANPPQFGSPLSSPPNDMLTLYVVLCYRECPTDNVPIPGDPCRSEDELLAPSRLTDDFKLELRYTPPVQQEEDALRDFVAWLSQIAITEGPGTFASVQDFEQAVRGTLSIIGSPPYPPSDSPPSSPPESLSISASDVCEYLRAAFRIWATELRSQWKAQGCAGDVPDEECVMLAELDVPVILTTTGWVVDPASIINVNEERRPYLIHLRLLQEWMLCGLRAISSLSPSDSVVAETTYNQAPDPGRSSEYSRGDHIHGTPPDPVLGGDVMGDTSSTTVQALQGIPVVAGQPNDRQVLTYIGGSNQWEAQDVPVPVTGDFVAHPGGAGTYGIVAAGIVKGDGTSRQPVYNGLIAQAVAHGQVHVLFKGYIPPNPNSPFQYIVKVLPVLNQQSPQLGLSVYFDHFDQPGVGFVLNVTNGNNILPAEQIAQLEFMIEVSQFPFPARPI